MSGSPISDETVGAFVDGELNEATALAIRELASRDEEVAARIDAFERTRVLLAEALDDVIREPVPQHMVEAIRRHRPRPYQNAVAAITRHLARPVRVPGFAVPLAATLLLVVVGVEMVYLATGRGPGADVAEPIALAFASKQIPAALSKTMSGESRAWSVPGSRLAGTITITGSYRIGGGAYCRTFHLTTDKDAIESVLAVGCKHNGHWRTDVAAVESKPVDGAFVPASEAATDTINRFLDDIGAEAPLDPAIERMLLRGGWKK